MGVVWVYQMCVWYGWGRGNMYVCVWYGCMWVWMWYGCMSGDGCGIGVSGVCETNLCSCLWYKKILSHFQPLHAYFLIKIHYFIKSVWNMHFEEHNQHSRTKNNEMFKLKLKYYALLRNDHKIKTRLLNHHMRKDEGRNETRKYNERVRRKKFMKI